MTKLWEEVPIEDMKQREMFSLNREYLLNKSPIYTPSFIFYSISQIFPNKINIRYMINNEIVQDNLSKKAMINGTHVSRYIWPNRIRNHWYKVDHQSIEKGDNIGWLFGVFNNEKTVVTGANNNRIYFLRQNGGEGFLNLNINPNIQVYKWVENFSQVINSTNNNYNTICSKCGAPAYQGLLDIECSRGCK